MKVIEMQRKVIVKYFDVVLFGNVLICIYFICVCYLMYLIMMNSHWKDR